MLVLSRKSGQRLQIGDDVRVTIIRIDRNTVRVGIEAPDGRAILREELLTDVERGAGCSTVSAPILQPA
ncbi:carbon storage regulator [Tautonia plasticadhaerens]|uniref:Translational regulator CsrA n=1 Tax=Tautonia plasticadhaerens TaxID=2527974 RepID=A0A518GWW3_9BACT|nr:carbon storage regulator [Tautonia plasticadhaerens]QDV33090.1 hypothetical protein ElP_09320 [Tautonia plasticadhaerens]